MIRLRDTLNDRIWSSHQYGIIDNCLHTSFRQSKGYLGIHSPPYGGGAGGRGFSLSFVFLSFLSFCLLLPCLCITLFFLSLFVILSENDYLCSEYV